MAAPKIVPPPDLTNSFFSKSHLAHHGQHLQFSYDSLQSPTSLESLANNLEYSSKPEAIAYGLVPSQRFPELHITFAPLPWESVISSATTQNEILLLLRVSGFKHTADRLRYLQHLAKNDPEEPSMLIDSMKGLVGFLTTERSLPDPEIGISPNGLAQIEWRIPPNGILAMEFLPTSLIRFAAISASTQHNDKRLRVNGTLPKSGVLDAVRPFTAFVDQPQ